MCAPLLEHIMSEKYTLVRTFNVKENEDSDTSVQVTGTFDFDGCSYEDLAAEAVKNLTVKIQGKYRRKWSDMRSQVSPTIKVADMLSGTRTQVDPAAFLNSMSPEQRIEWLIEKGLIPAPEVPDAE